MELSLAENRKPCRGRMFVGWRREKLGLPFGTQKFEMSIRHPNGDIKQAVVYVSLEFSREVGAENINLRVSGI